MNRRDILWSLPFFLTTAMAQAQRPSGTKRKPVVDEPSLKGNWLLTMPRGFEYNAVLETGPEYGLLRLQCGALNLQGLYELKDGKLVMVKPDNQHLAGLEWDIRNQNTLILEKQPNTAQVGSDYRGATLGRQKQAKSRT